MILQVPANGAEMDTRLKEVIKRLTPKICIRAIYREPLFSWMVWAEDVRSRINYS